MDAEEPFIRVEHLTKVFHKSRGTGWLRRKRGPGFTAVDDVSFQVGRGQIFVVMGLSGSGKSTIIRMLNRLVETSSGSIAVGGRDVLGLAPAELRAYRNRTINMVFQHFGLFPHKSLIDNVAFGLKVRGVDRAVREAKATEALALVGLGDRVHAMPEELSGGMRQRVGLARALATDAEILLMDEPFSALDPLIRKDMQELLIKLQRNFKKTIVFVTHDLNEAMHLGDRIMVMKQGRMIQTGTAVDLLDAPADPYIEEFVAEVDRSRVLTIGMLTGTGTATGTGGTGGTGAHAAVPAGEGVPSVAAGTTLHEVLALFAAGAPAVQVTDEHDVSLGRVSAPEVFAALAPKEYGNES
ncbi:hypothetical protein GCM10023081_17500 [Arthrobacter ginkgonis]|uniref:ABC transporter domain-containing protein n=2 Tax=Arthrobacter ginkgonis TaxID=1630594 RepID=A0ABP7C4R8_9MICC